MVDDEDLSIWFDQVIAEIEAAREAKKIRLENPWALHLIKILYPRGEKGLRRQDVIEELEKMRKPLGLSTPKAFSETVSSAFQRYCVGAAAYMKSGASSEDGFFLMPKGKGLGIWGVDREKALAWLKAKQKQI